MPDTKKQPVPEASESVDPANLLPSKIMLIDTSPGDSAADHPDVAEYVEDGWRVKSAVPRIVEAKGPRTLVVLTRSRSTFPGIRRKTDKTGTSGTRSKSGRTRQSGAKSKAGTTSPKPRAPHAA